METELYDNTPTPTTITLTLQAESFLRNTAKWGKFMAIVGFVITGLMVLGGLFGGALLTGLIKTDNQLLGFGGGAIVTFSFVTAIYFIPVLYLYKFSSKMNKGLDAKDENEITESLRNLKSLFQFAGIFTVIVLIFYALAFVLQVFAPIIHSMN